MLAKFCTYLYVAFLWGILTTFSLSANRPAIAQSVIAINEIAGVANSNETGPYVDAIRALRDRIGNDVKIRVYPIKRAVISLSRSIAFCLFPTSNLMLLEHNLDPNKYIFSRPVNRARQFIFTTKNAPKINSLDDLDGKILGYRLGWHIAEKLREKSSFTMLPAQSDLHLYNLAHQDRIDAILGWVPDFNLLYEAERLPPLTHNPSLIIEEVAEHIACHNKPMAKQFIQKIDLAIEDMEKTGELKKILGPAWVAK